MDLAIGRVGNVDVLEIVVHCHEDVGKGGVGNIDVLHLLSPTDGSGAIPCVWFLICRVAGALTPGGDGDESEGEQGVCRALHLREELSPGGDHRWEATGIARLLLLGSYIPLVGSSVIPDGSLDGRADEGIQHAVPQGGTVLVGSTYIVRVIVGIRVVEVLIVELTVVVGTVYGVDVRVAPGLNDGTAPRGRDQADGNVDSSMQTDAEVPAGGTEEAPVGCVST